MSSVSVPRCTLVVGLILLSLSTTALPQDAAAPGGVSILDGGSIFRVLYSWNAPLAKTGDGTVEIRPKPGRGVCKCDAEFNYLTVYPPADWTAAEFDDSGWTRRPFLGKHVNGESDHRAGGGMADPHLRQLSLRGKFAVTDPTKVRPLTLALAYRGGAIVYLNGKEIARANLPAPSTSSPSASSHSASSGQAPSAGSGQAHSASSGQAHSASSGQGGKVEPGAPAELYDRKVYLREDGKPQLWFPPNDEAAKAFALRQRRLEKISIPAGDLRKGVNVLAVEIHAAAYPEEYLKTGVPWGSAGLIELSLKAESAEGLTPNVTRPGGLQVWNTNVMSQLYNAEYGDPNEPLRPMELAGARNGCYSGRVAVGSDAAMKGLSAKVSELVGEGGRKIPASAVRVGYGKFDALCGSRWGGALDYRMIAYGALDVLRDDALLDSPPAEVALSPKPATGAVQTVYVTARIPKDAAAGDYAGTLSITADGAKPTEVPVKLKVLDWTLPDPADFSYFLGMIQSPEGVALTYDVPLWSDKHLALVGKSLDYVGQLGPRVLFLNLGAESQYGNEQSLVLWTKAGGGKYTHDFKHVEKYVDVALKHMGKPQFVVLGVWDSCMHVSAPKETRREFPRFSVLDPKTGALENLDGPAHGTPESLEFWKPVLTGVKDILAKRGLDQAMLLGYAADKLPTKETVEVFNKILPGVGWQSTRHGERGGEYLTGESANPPVLYHANVWGGWEHHDPDCRRPYGWNNPVKPSLRTWLDRDLFDASPITQFRTAAEQAMLADRHGLGQLGADFWPVKGKDGKPQGTMVGRFPGTNEGNLGIYAGQLLYAAPDGPVPSLRYEMLRENVQECEARIFLEKLLSAKPPGTAGVPWPAGCPLAEDLAKRCQAVLDERTRWHRIRTIAGEASLYWADTGWQGRTIKLYEAAGLAAARPGSPNSKVAPPPARPPATGPAK